MIWPLREPEAQIAPLRREHAAAASALHGRAFAHGWSETDLDRLIADPACIGTAAVSPRSGRLCGFVLSRSGADEGEILTIVVGDENRGRGLGGALLAPHMASLSGRGVRRLFLEVEEGNVAALALYRRFGFAEVGRRNAYYRKADGSRATALVLRRDLD